MLVRHDSGTAGCLEEERPRETGDLLPSGGPRCGPSFPYAVAFASQSVLSSPFLTALVPIVSFPREISAAINSAPADRSLE